MLLERAVGSILAQGRPVILYCHPYEWNPGEMDDFRGKVDPFMAFTQSLGRGSFIRSMRRLFSTLRFGTFDEVISGWRTDRRAAR
jgi:hypothetical protein